MKLAAILLTLSAAFLFGCSDEAGGHEGQGDQDHDANSEAPTGDHQPDGDSAVALPAGANQLCPVTGEEVLSDLYYEHEGTKIYLCCDDCLDKVKKDPEKYFAKAYPHHSK